MRILFRLSILVSCLLMCPGLSAEEYPYVAVITGENVYVRAGQDQNFEEVAQLKEGRQVVVVGKAYSWYKVKLPSEAESYVSSKFVTSLGDNIGEIIGNKINIRSRKSLKSTTLGQLNKGDLVRIRQKDGEWTQIEPLDHNYGWVYESFVKFQSKEIPPDRSVEPPVRNIYKRKRMVARQTRQESTLKPGAAAQPSPAPEQNLIHVTGLVQDLGEKSITQNIRHRLVCDDNKVYFLKGYRTIIDTFLNYKVQVEAEVLTDIQAPAEVLLVKKIQLVL